MLEVIGGQCTREGFGRLVTIESAPVPSSQKAGKQGGCESQRQQGIVA
jgi:hypothetical protein